MIGRALFERALDMWGGEGHRLPHDVYPGDHLYVLRYDGEREAPAVSEDGWLDYRWNPPGYHVHAYPLADPRAAPKPTWKQLEGHALEVARQDAIERLRLACQQRITLGYNERNTQDEAFSRLRALEEAAPEKLKRRIKEGDVERDRLLARYQAGKTRIATLTDIHTIIALDFARADVWANKPDAA